MPNQAVSWDYYEGAYGPSILVEVPDHDAVSGLQHLFLRLARGGVSVDLANEPGMHLQHMSGLELELAKDASNKTLFKTDESGFLWSCSPAQWRRNKELLDPFLEGRPGHQYLTEEGIDDALVEVSFREAHGTQRG